MGKFLTLFETAISRYTSSGVTIGDVVKLIDGYKAVEDYKSLQKDVKNAIKSIFESGNHVRVTENRNVYTNGVVEIAVDHGGGKLTDHVIVPVNILTFEATDGVNLTPLAKASTYESKITLKPEPVESAPEEITSQTHKDKKEDRQLKNKNVKIPSTEAKNKDEGTYKYLKGLD